MSRRDDEIALRQMLDHAREAIAMSDGRRRGDLDADRQLELALTRLVEVVGEAASRVSEATRIAHPAVPWRQIVAMRHRLIHGYDDVDLDILWEVVRHDLPDLIPKLEAIGDL